MQIRFSDNAKRQLKEIDRKDKKLSLKIKEKMVLFRVNPRHPSLRLHKLSGGLHDLRSISINRSIRMVYIQLEDEIYITQIGTHDEVYRK